MSYELLLALLCMATGFVFAAILSNLYHLIMARPPLFFATHEQKIADCIFSSAVCVLGGPFMLMRNAIHTHLGANNSLSLMLLTACLISLWSFGLGIFILDLILTLSAL